MLPSKSRGMLVSLLTFTASNNASFIVHKCIFCCHANTLSSLATIVIKDGVISCLCVFGKEKYMVYV